MAGKTAARQKVGLGGHSVGPVGKVTAAAPGIIAVFVYHIARGIGYVRNGKAHIPFPRRGKAWIQFFKELTQP